MKILVVHATAGAGHKKAAEAIYHGLKAQGQDARLVDALDYTNSFFKITYPSTYAFLVTKLPWVWAFFFTVLNIPFLQPLIRIIRRFYNGFNAKKLQQYMIDGKFDAIIATQFLSAEVSAHLKRSGQIKARVICVVTDFDVHRIWVNEGTDVYTAASPMTKERLISLGVPAKNIFVTGIPTDAVFGQVIDKDSLCARLGLESNQFTILLATGSFGMGPMEQLIDALNEYQLIVVCGHNHVLFERLRGKAVGDVHVFGLVDNMHELMSIADVMVTKPGGLSIAEALVKRLPMIFFSAIPGQETQNIKVLKKYSVGMDQMRVPEIVKQVQKWYAHPQMLKDLKQNLLAVSKPTAVEEIIQLL